MEIDNIGLISTVLVEAITLGLLSLIALSPMGMAVWLATHQEDEGLEVNPEPAIKHHHRHTHHKAHPAH